MTGFITAYYIKSTECSFIQGDIFDHSNFQEPFDLHIDVVSLFSI